MRKYKHEARIICSQCFARKEGETRVEERAMRTSRKVCGVVVVVHRRVLCTLVRRPGGVYLLILHKGVLVDGLHHISEENF